MTDPQMSAATSICEGRAAPVIVLGMHRSGTSLVAGSLQAAGVHLGEVNDEAPFNKKGNKEHTAVRNLNDRILAANGATWRSPPSGQLNWDDGQRAEARAIIQGFDDGPQPWGFKDPRTIWTIEGWLGLVPHARLVGVFRAPALSAQSLASRLGDLFVDFDQGLDLWARYNSELLALFDRLGFPLVEFTEPAATLEQLMRTYGALGLGKPEQEFLAPNLIHQRESHGAVPTDARELYDRLRDAQARWSRSHGTDGLIQRHLSSSAGTP